MASPPISQVANTRNFFLSAILGKSPQCERHPNGASPNVNAEPERARARRAWLEENYDSYIRSNTRANQVAAIRPLFRSINFLDSTARCARGPCAGFPGNWRH